MRTFLNVALCLALLITSGGALAAPAPSWKDIDRLVDDQKLEEAAKGVRARLDAARARKDEAEWARALVRLTQLRIGLHGYETAVRELREQPWPAGAVPRTAVELTYARALVTYAQRYAWEVQQRERVESTGPVDLKAWTAEQIWAEAHRAFGETWGRREALGRTPVKALAGTVEPGTYPAHVRGTARDAVTHLWVQLLEDTAGWRPEQQRGVYQLDLAELAEGTPQVKLDDPAVHPLRKVAALLADLEAWHAGAQRREAALDARLERLRVVHGALEQEPDRARVRAALEKRLAQDRDVAWWAMGQGQLADFERAAGLLTRARASAEAGRKADPRGLGGQRCAALVAELDAPDYALATMRLEGPRQRSIEVTHRNVPALHFRAYVLDVEAELKRSDDYSLLPDHRRLRALVSGGKPAARWSAQLSATPDLRPHRTFVVPPLTEPGTYVIAASAREDFAEADNRVVASVMTVGRWALVTRSEENRSLEVVVQEGATGAVARGVEVRLIRLDWQSGHREVERQPSDADGQVRFTPKQGDHAQYVVVAGRGRDAVLDVGGHVLFERPERPQRVLTSLVFTDRSIYRPQQQLQWKAVLFEGEGAQARYRTAGGAPVEVALMDANHQKVESVEVRTNGFGTAAGAFTLPAGRALGRWHLRVTPRGASGAQPVPGMRWFRVEEYKRPTFEVTLKDPQEAPRLNVPATFRGEARYYFGLPVTAGAVRWTVRREPVWPWWWGSWFRVPGPGRAGEVVASGTSKLGDDGGFTLTFTPQADARAQREVSYRYRVEADVTDEGGETRSGDRAFRLGFVGVEARVELEQGFLRADAAAQLKVLRTDLDGSPRAGKGRWRLLALKGPQKAQLPADLPRGIAPGEEEPPQERAPEGEPQVQTPGDAQRPRWASLPLTEAILQSWAAGAAVAQGEVAHDANGAGQVALPGLKPGAYRLEYETQDAAGQTFKMARNVLVAGPQAFPVPLAAVLEAERTSVKAGETARLLAATGVEGGVLTLDVYQGAKRLSRRQVRAGAAGAVVDIPVTPELRGGFTAVLWGVRDFQYLERRQTFFVPFDDKELTVEFATFRDTLRPGQKESWRVTVKGPRGAKVEAGAAELLAYMYDRSLDLFAPHDAPAVSQLYPQRSADVSLRAALGAAAGQHLLDGGYGRTPGWEPPQPAQLIAVDEYGIGGPGRRRRGVGRAMSYESLAEAGPPPPAPMPTAAPAADSMMVQRAPVAQKAAGQAAGAAPEAAEPPRTNFAETAFWLPQLLTGADGSATLEFQVPDSVTSWNVWVHALTRDLQGGSATREVRTVKELMVRPYVPRFLREGDVADVEVVLNNAGAQALTGDVSFDIQDPETGKSVAGDFGLKPGAQRFTVQPGKGTTVRYRLTAPKRVGTVAFRVTAKAGAFSDGELRPLPVLPGRMHLAQSRFVALREGDAKTLTFADLQKSDDPTRVNDRLVVTVDGQLFYGVLQALPYLLDYPYECTEQTLNRFVSSGIVSSVFEKYPAVAKMARELDKTRTGPLETWDAADPNRKMALEESPWLQESQGFAGVDRAMVRVLDPDVARAQRAQSLAKLAKAQTSAGGFPWWPGGPPSPYMTLYIVHGLARAAEHGVEVPRDMTQRAWGYLARHYREEWAQRVKKDEAGWEFVTFLNYVASAYPDASFTGSALTADERKAMLAYSFKHWRKHSPYLKGYLALTLQRAGRAADATKVWSSVMDSAKQDEQLGVYWAQEDRSWLWYNDTTETHAFALRTLMELAPQDARRHGLVQWLLLDKKLNHWKSTRATAEAIYALVKYLEKEGALSVREEVRVAAGDRTAAFVFEPDVYTGKRNQLVVPGPDVGPQRGGTVTVQKVGKGTAFASATWHFSTERLPDADRGDFFQVSRRYFRRERRGTEAVLSPLAEGAVLKPGDEVEVQLSLRTKHAAEYVHLRDPRAAGLEPENPVSRFKWDTGLGYYEEVRDSGTNFFFEWLPVGEYTFKYRLRANMGGTFRVHPATVQSMYAPEFNAYSSGAVLEVRKD